MDQKQHIRPRIRKRSTDDVPAVQLKEEDEDLEELIAKTRQCMTSWVGCGLPTSNQSTNNTTNESAADQKMIVTPERNNEVARDKTVLPLSSKEAPSTMEEEPSSSKKSDSTQPRGILRKPRYSSRPSSSSSEHLAVEHVDNDDSAAAPIQQNQSQLQPACIKDLVVERDPSQIMKPSQLSEKNAATFSSQSVEGYTPSMTQLPRSSKSNDDDSSLILSTISELLAHDPKSLQQQRLQDDNAPKKVVEADLSFACMTPEEYQETLELHKFMGENVPSAADETLAKDIDVQDELTPSAGPENVFCGRNDVFPDEEEDDDDESSDEDNDLMDLLIGHDEEESMPPPEPRAFLKLWSALSDWVTPEAVALILDWQDVETALTLNPGWQPQVDRSDVGASRCAGLMAILKMHMTRCLTELGYGFDMRRTAESRLANLLRTFDYSQPTPTLNPSLWRAMTSVLLHMVLFQGEYDNNGDSATAATPPSTLPASVQAVGMNTEEYRYLTTAALTSLDSSSSSSIGRA